MSAPLTLPDQTSLTESLPVRQKTLVCRIHAFSPTRRGNVPDANCGGPGYTVFEDYWQNIAASLSQTHP